MRNEFFMYFCIKSSIGTQGEVGQLKRVLNTPVVYSIDRSKAVVLVLPTLLSVLLVVL